MSSDDEKSVQERRTEADPKLRDRRVVPRVAEADLRQYMKFCRQLCRFAVGFSAVYIVGIIVGHFWGSRLELNRSLFVGVVVAVIAVGVHRLGQAIGSYIETESTGRLVVVAERLYQALFLLIASGVILGIVHLITLF